MGAFLPGTEVTFRGLRWEVVYSQPGGTDLDLYRLRCLDAGLRGTEMDVVHPFEPLEPVTTEMDPARPGRLDTWRVYHQAFLLEQALGTDTLVAVQPGRLRIAPYQLVPVMRALRMSRVRLMLADGVGLGKTVEAGLVLAELIARRRANRILVVSPAGPWGPPLPKVREGFPGSRNQQDGRRGFPPSPGFRGPYRITWRC